jgi:hypothetical protein
MMFSAPTGFVARTAAMSGGMGGELRMASSVAGTCLRLEVRVEEGDDAPASVFG